MSLLTVLGTLRADIRRYAPPEAGFFARLQAAVGTQGIWAITVFRLGQWVYERPRPLLGAPARLAYKLAAKGVEVVTGISLPASARIGPGFYVGHFGAIIVHPRTVMGAGCSIGQGVTLGTRGRGDRGVPVVGDNVYIGAGAKVLGGVHVGDNAAVGANAVVVHDVPADNVAVGVPARCWPPREPRSAGEAPPPGTPGQSAGGART